MAPKTVTPEDLKARRLALGLSQQGLADELGVLTNTLARWEQGVVAIGQPKLLDLALRYLEAGEDADPPLAR